jgi:hypothetical protein
MKDLVRDWKSWNRAEQVVVAAAAIFSMVVVAAGFI